MKKVDVQYKRRFVNSNELIEIAIVVRDPETKRILLRSAEQVTALKIQLSRIDVIHEAYERLKLTLIPFVDLENEKIKPWYYLYKLIVNPLLSLDVNTAVWWIKFKQLWRKK